MLIGSSAEFDYLISKGAGFVALWFVRGNQSRSMNLRAQAKAYQTRPTAPGAGWAR